MLHHLINITHAMHVSTRLRATLIAVLCGMCTSSVWAQEAEGSARRRFAYIYAEAAKQAELGRHAYAYALYSHCLRVMPQSDEAMAALGVYYAAIGLDSMAQRMLTQAVELSPDCTDYIEQLTAHYLRHNDTEQALLLLERLAALRPRNMTYLARLEQAYESQDRLLDAIQTLGRMELIDGRTLPISQRKATLYHSLDRPADALAEMQAIAADNPHDNTYRLYVADELLKLERNDEAQAILADVQRQEPDNPNMHYAWLKFYRTTGQDSLYNALRDSLLYGRVTDDGVRLTVLRATLLETLTSAGGGNPMAVFERLDTIVPRRKYIEEMRLAVIATYADDAEADSMRINVMKRIYDIDPTDRQALAALIQYYGMNEDYAHLEDVCLHGVLAYPELLVYHYYLAISLIQRDANTEAIRTLHEGLRQREPDEVTPELVASVFSLLGDMLHQEGRRSECYEAYDSCLVYDADNAMCLNNYAYFLSVEGADLDRAEEMSYRSLRRNQDNKTYLDTYAWILFAKGAYAEAQAYMDRVCPPSEADSTLLADAQLSQAVLEHAGDIAALNGRMEQAMRFWQLALDKEPSDGEGDSSALLRRKLKKRKYIRPRQR